VKSELTLSDFFDTAISSVLENIHTTIPGRVKSYAGHKTRLAVVQPSIRLPMLAGPSLDVPAIHGVPMVFPSTGSGSLLFPVKAGDGVLIVFSEVGFGKFMASATGDVVDADSVHQHALTDAIAIPGMFSPKALPKLPKADLSKTVLSSIDGALLEMGAKIHLKNDVSDLHKEMKKIWDAIDTLRGDLAQQFLQASTCMAGDAGFMFTTVPSLAASAAAQTAARAALAVSKAELGGLLK
jgi:hypothetical protein